MGNIGDQFAAQGFDTAQLDHGLVERIGQFTDFPVIPGSKPDGVVTRSHLLGLLIDLHNRPRNPA